MMARVIGIMLRNSVFPANFKDNTSSNALMVGGIRSIVWTSTGWPLVMPERYGAVPQKAISESELVGNWQNINLIYNYQKQDASTTMVLGSDHKVKSGWNVGSTWSFDAVSSVLTIDTVKLYLKREVDWEVSPRKVTIVYAGYSPAGTTTYWGKHVSENN
jgi:hypothetical protein